MAGPPEAREPGTDSSQQVEGAPVSKPVSLGLLVEVALGGLPTLVPELLYTLPELWAEVTSASPLPPGQVEGSSKSLRAFLRDPGTGYLALSVTQSLLSLAQGPRQILSFLGSHFPHICTFFGGAALKPP